MNLTPMQLFCQEKILLALYPGLSIDEAREKELSKLGCIVIDKLHSFFGNPAPETMIKIYGDENCGKDDGYYFTHYRGNPGINESIKNLLDNTKYNIIGLPPTLPRVLKSLGNEYIFDSCRQSIAKNTDIIRSGQTLILPKYITNRISFNEDKTDTTLRDQSPETQFAIAKLQGLVF